MSDCSDHYSSIKARDTPDPPSYRRMLNQVLTQAGREPDVQPRCFIRKVTASTSYPYWECSDDENNVVYIQRTQSSL
jgi:hypothetical protein